MLSCIFSVCFYASFLLKWKWSYVTSELTVLRAQRFPVDFTDECKLSWVWPEDVKKLSLLSHSEVGRWCFRPEEAEHPLLQWKTSRFNFGYVTVCVAVASLYCCSKCWRRLIWCLCEIYRPQWYPGLCDCVTSAPGICSGSWCSLQKGNCLHFWFHYSLESSWTVFVDTSITFMQIPTALLTIVVT